VLPTGFPPPSLTRNTVIFLTLLFVSVMKLTSFFAAALALPLQFVQANYAFAHVVVGNTAAHDQATWAQDIAIAQACGIDAFVLNIAYPDANIPTQVANAFAAAEAAGSTFKLFFAFDYLGGGQTWPATGTLSVVSYLNQYKGSAAYFNYNDMPFASTFEGTGNIADWAPGGAIRAAVGDVYFVPDWTSLGTGGISASLANIQGFFSWDMWPNGATNQTDAVDKAWQSAIGSSKTYMMEYRHGSFTVPVEDWTGCGVVMTFGQIGGHKSWMSSLNSFSTSSSHFHSLAY
jgi:glucan endo-1,3-alpha-glucosidase